MGQFSLGQPVRRLEDQRFLTGHGRFIEDIDLPRQLRGYVLRSPHAHAVIRRIDTAAARKAPGVAGVFTAEDMKDVGPIPCVAPVTNADGSPMANPPRHALARGRVRHVGEPVAFIVAETLAQARDAAELVEVDYDPLPAVADSEAALEPGAPQLWDEAPGNLCFTWEIGDKAKTEAGFRDAAHVVRLRLVNNRVVVNAMEPRGAVAAYDPGEGRFTLYTSSQGSHFLRDQLADQVFRVPRDRFRVVTPDVGGGFGMKNFLHPEQVLAVFAARATGRPVKWVNDRSESFASDSQARDHVTEAELALDKDGHFLAMRIVTLANLGAALSNAGPFIPTLAGAGMLAGLYKTPALHATVKGVFTNTVPTDAYRGAGRPEAAYLVERMVDLAARQLKLTPAEIRRRNFIPPDAFPFTTAAGETYDSGDFAAHMEKAMKQADWAGFEARRQASRAAGKLRGIGMATYVEACGGAPGDMAEIRFEPDGAVSVLIGTQNNGQGHQTAYAQVTADKLGIPIERVRVVQGDTDIIPYGNGTGGSRSIPVGANAIRIAADRIIERSKRIAGDLLEAAVEDIEFADGRFTVAGTDKSVTFAQVAAAAFDQERAGGEAAGLSERAGFQPKQPTYPNGCHIAEVEIDPETGIVTLLNYTIVDDFGVVLNPLLLAGQVHGGTVQGIGQALFEHTVYDRESAQLLSASFMDYRLPRAGDVPMISFDTNNVPCRTNPMGIKGAGEAGTIGAPPAVINAVVDALSELGITHIDMPATPLRVWEAIRSARASAGHA
ncbi:MAG: xanthine dehydrogenase family protein molybdopterin-binding subunit [Rhodospirillaceae bacterium]|nr:xanthine dehydrogenase family protein molybdopterin-binding subunit [Rhodospirillaceae bacterium]